MRVLVVCVESPWPPAAGAPLRTWEWLRAAARGATLGVVSLVRDGEEDEVAEALGRVAVFVRTLRAPRTPMRRARAAVRAALLRVPYLVASGREPAFRHAVVEAVRRFRPDIVQAEQLGAAFSLEVARQWGVRGLYSAHNVEERIVAGPPGAGLPPWRRWQRARMRREEGRVVRQADAVVAVSEAEARWFAQQGARVHVVPNGVDVSAHAFVPPSRREDGAIVFVGHLAYPPNVDAVETLIGAVLPRLRVRHPEVPCLVAGRRPARGVRRLVAGSAGVELLASPRDAREAWGRARLLVCPLRWGAGSRIKLLEAAACGVPIVATAVSAEGLALRPGIDFLAAEGPDELAHAAAQVLSDPRRAAELAREARATVQRHHDWGRFARLLEGLYSEIGGGR